MSKIEHSIFDKNFTYFSNPHKGDLPIDQSEIIENSFHEEKIEKSEERAISEEKGDIDDDKIKTDNDDSDSLEGCLVSVYN